MFGRASRYQCSLRVDKADSPRLTSGAGGMQRFFRLNWDFLLESPAAAQGGLLPPQLTRDHAKTTHSKDGEGACCASVCPVRSKRSLLRSQRGSMIAQQ